MVRGEHKDLYPGDTIIVCHNGEEYKAVVETRYNGGAVVKVVLEN